MRTVSRVITIAAIGALMATGCGGASSGSTTPSAAAAPSAASASAAAPSAPAPTSAGSPKLPGEGSVVAGTYALDPDLGITMDVPAGWQTCCDGALVKNDFDGILYGGFDDITVYGDPCTWSTASTSKPKGAAAIAAALAAQPGREATQPKDVTVGGLPAVHVRLKVPADQKVTSAGNGDFTFEGCDQGEFRSFTDAAGGTRYHQAPTQTDDFYFVDVDGRTFLLDVVTGPELASAEQAVLDAMVASVRID